MAQEANGAPWGAGEAETASCESCRHAGPPETHYLYVGSRPCIHPDWRLPMSSCHFVPLVVAGRPFGCLAWEAQ